MIKFSDAANRLKGQEMFQILEKAQALEREGKKIIHFELGDPDFKTPSKITESCYNALKNGYTHYCNSRGLRELREVSAESIERGRRKFKPSIKQLLVTPGANVQIDYAVTCCVNPGEEVIVPDPGFVSYYSILALRNINAIRIPLKEENEFRLNPKDVENAITDKTKMIIINSPSNPTGALMTEQEIREIYDIAEKNDLWLLSDEIYTRMVYEDDKTKFFSPSMIDKCKERTIVVNGFSKSYAMTGWRLGIMMAPEELIEKLALNLETTSSCVPPFLQLAGITALNDEEVREDVHKMINEYKERRDLIVSELNSIRGIKCLNPQGAFYVFPNIKNTGMNSREFADFMLAKAGVAISPGNIFGHYGEGYVRLCYVSSKEEIKEGILRMKNALNK